MKKIVRFFKKHPWMILVLVVGVALAAYFIINHQQQGATTTKPQGTVPHKSPNQNPHPHGHRHHGPPHRGAPSNAG